MRHINQISFPNGLDVTLQSMHLPCSSDSKESAINAGDLGSIPGLGRSPGEGNDKSTLVFLPGESHGQKIL